MEKVSLLDFWAAWCGPCKVMHPIIDELEKEYAGKAKIVKYDVDDAANQSVVEKYQVMAMPTYFIEKDGQVVAQFVGAQSKKTLAEALDKALD